MKYKHFLFDADNTVFDYRQGEKNAFDQIAKHYNLTFDDEVLDTYHRINKWCWEAYERGELAQEELVVLRFKNLFDELSIDEDPVEMESLFTTFLSKQICLMPHAKELLDELQYNGCNIEMITNGVSATQYGRLEATNLKAYFSNIFISSEMGCQKPDYKYFDIVLNKIKADRSECVIIGDRLESDIRGGLNAHIDTIWLNTGKSSNMENDGSVHPTYEIECLSEIMDLVR
jgi:YjjG family noncanonical pyrimidine nucleotidase